MGAGNFKPMTMETLLKMANNEVAAGDPCPRCEKGRLTPLDEADPPFYICDNFPECDFDLSVLLTEDGMELVFDDRSVAPSADDVYSAAIRAMQQGMEESEFHKLDFALQDMVEKMHKLAALKINKKGPFDQLKYLLSQGVTAHTIRFVAALYSIDVPRFEDADLSEPGLLQ